MYPRLYFVAADFQKGTSGVMPHFKAAFGYSGYQEQAMILPFHNALLHLEYNKNLIHLLLVLLFIQYAQVFS